MAVAIARQRRSTPPHLIRPHALAGLVREDGTIDWSPWYLTQEEDMGQGGEQGEIIEVLRSSLEVLAAERGWSIEPDGPAVRSIEPDGRTGRKGREDATSGRPGTGSSVLVASDNFFAWVDGEPHVQVSPDVYLLDDPPASDEPLPGRWETWRPEHHPPRFAVEIVSSQWKKDYDINPARYDHLGVGELVLADRDAFVRGLGSDNADGEARGRASFLVYRRTAKDRLELVHHGDGPAYCAEIDAYLCFQWSSPGRPRVRISRDSAGVDIIPTFAEKSAAQAAEIAAQAAEIAALHARLRDLEGT